MFDWVEITVKGGNGGKGAISFRHEKFVPFGGPDGGDGGDGGDVVLRTESSVTNLNMFKNRGKYLANNGEGGKGKKQHGKRGKNLILLAPIGTLVHESSPGHDRPIADLIKEGQLAIIAKGGKGGLGNIHYITSTNQVPRIAQRGEIGEQHTIILELRYIADIGLIGYPNAGKSTLLSKISAANPKIANYPFTTLGPVLGKVELDQKSFTIAEIPGLINGAHLGRGLGHDFLRHIMRTKILIHLIDGSSKSPLDDMVQVNKQLNLFDRSLARKPQLVAVNKIDLPHAKIKLPEIKLAFSEISINVHFISALTGDGLPVLLENAYKLLHQKEIIIQPVDEQLGKVFYPQSQSKSIVITKENNIYIVTAPSLERLTTSTGKITDELKWYIKRQLNRLGINRSLKKAGAKVGDRVRCGDIEWLWE
jgi:GTP-binding protein